MMSKNTKIVLALLAAVLVLAVVPFFLAPGAEFGGSDDAGSRMVEQIQGEAYEPWFTPVLETLLGGELPGEIESLLFCVQTGIGVGVLAYGFGYFAARKKYSARGCGMKVSARRFARGPLVNAAFQESPAGDEKMFNALLGALWRGA